MVQILLSVFLVVTGAASAYAKTAKPTQAGAFNKCLNSMKIESDEYVKSSKADKHYLFKSNLDGFGLNTKANSGFFEMTPDGFTFCELNFPRKTNFEFSHDDEVVVKKHSQAKTSDSQSLSGPSKKCVKADDAGEYAFSNQILGRVYKIASEGGKSAAKLKAELKDCLDIPRVREKINDGVKSAQAQKSGAEKEGKDDSTSNAEGDGG